MRRVRSFSPAAFGRKLLTAAGWTALLLAAAVAGRASAQTPLAPADYIDRFEQRLSAAADSGDFVGLAVAVVDQGEIVLLKTFGDTVYDGEERVSADTVFRLASVSKGFSATLVGKLAEEGRLSWGDPISTYQPKFKLKTTTATNAVTLENIASHRVGLPRNAYDGYLESGESVEKILDRTSKLDLICKPGDCYSYQNISYSLLADAVEKVEGRKFDEVMEERIFTPLGMETASVGLDRLRASRSWARPHSRRRSSSPWRAFEPNDDYYRVAAAGGLNASILDMVQWTRAQLGYAPDVVDPELRETVQSPRVDTPYEYRKLRWMRGRLKDTDYALGWRVYDYAGERLITHAGGVAGYRAVVALLPERDLGFAVLWNSTSGRGWRIMPELLDAYLGLESNDWLDVDDVLAAAAGETHQGSP
jgi:beta-lactamase class C